MPDLPDYGLREELNIPTPKQAGHALALGIAKHRQRLMIKHPKRRRKKIATMDLRKHPKFY